jgi:NitT/TauT family transport system permease protein
MLHHLEKIPQGTGLKKYLGIILSLLAFAVLWQLAAILVKRPFLPGVAETIKSLIRLGITGKLWRHLGMSFSRIMWALVFAGIPAVVLGLAAGRSPKFNRFVSPAIYLLHPLPKAAFLPIIMLFMGLGEASKIFLVGFIIFSQILVTIRDAATRVPPELLDSIRSFGAGKLTLYREVIFPAVLPDFFTALRISLGTAVAVLFLAETFASESGLGYLIVDAWTRVAYAEMYAAILTLSLLGLALFILTDLLEALLCPWR